MFQIFLLVKAIIGNIFSKRENSIDPKKEDIRDTQDKESAQYVAGPFFTNLVVVVISIMLAVLLWIFIIVLFERIVQPLPYGRLWWMIPSTLLVFALFTLPRIFSEEATVKTKHQSPQKFFGKRLIRRISTVVYKNPKGADGKEGKEERIDIVTASSSFALLEEGRHGKIPFLEKDEEDVFIGPHLKVVEVNVLNIDDINTKVKVSIDFLFKNILQVNQAGGQEEVIERIGVFIEGGIRESVAELKSKGEKGVRSKKGRDKIKNDILAKIEKMEMVWGFDVVDVSILDVDFSEKYNLAMETRGVIKEHAEGMQPLIDKGLSPAEANQTSKIIRGSATETFEQKKYDVGPALNDVVIVLGKILVERLFSASGTEHKTSSKEEVPSYKEECSKPANPNL